MPGRPSKPGLTSPRQCGTSPSCGHAADKVVYSRTLEHASTARTVIERDFDPEAVRALKASAGEDLAVGGPDLAGQALRAGLVDEIQLFLTPVVVGGGTSSLPDGVRLDLELLEERRFESGVVFLRYARPGLTSVIEVDPSDQMSRINPSCVRRAQSERGSSLG